jgi:hypothetical protein
MPHQTEAGEFGDTSNLFSRNGHLEYRPGHHDGCLAVIFFRPYRKIPGKNHEIHYVCFSKISRLVIH